MSLKAAAQHIAAHGRNGDTTLVHMTPHEVHGLQQLAQANGTSLTVNPHTGLPEAFSLGSFLEKAAPLAAAYFLGPAAGEALGVSSAAGAGLAAGATGYAMTGDLNKGLQAGLLAYGGAGLAGGAEKGIESAAMAKDPIAMQNAAATANEIGAAEAAKIAPNPLTTGEAFQAGIKGMGSLGLKDLAKYGGAALLGSGALNPSKPSMPTGTNVDGYIRPKTYDPVTHRYYDLPAVKASDWGSQSIDDYRNRMVAPAREGYATGGITDDGMAGGGPMMGSDSAFDFQQHSEPVVRMADGGYASFSADDINNYIAQNNLDAAGIAAAEKQFNVDPAAVAAAQASISGSGGSGISAAAPAYTQYSNDQMANYFAQNPNVNVADAVKQFNADPNAVNQYITGLTSGYQDPTATQRGSGYMPQYQNLIKEGMTPAEFAAAAKANDPNWGTGYWNQGTVAHAYDVAKDIANAGDTLKTDKDWVALMDADKITVDDVSRATGLTAAEVQRRYDAAKGKPAVVTPDGKTTQTQIAPNSTTDTYTGGTTTTPSTYRPAGASNPYGNYINPGDITINPDGSKTVTPNIPGRPYGGFTGMGQVTDAYTAGGGHLGQVLKPTQGYTVSGGTKAALDYLMGKAPWSATKTQAALPARNTYSDFSSPSTDEKKQFAKYAKVWKNGVLVDNPFYNYVEPTAATTTNTTTPTTDAANGGLMDAYAAGGQAQYNLGGYSDGGRLLKGPGDGVSDSIPATIGNKQPARLADGEFVVPARIVSELGNGSTEAGARKLYAMMDRVQKARGKTVGKGKVAKNTRADKYLPG